MSRRARSARSSCARRPDQGTGTTRQPGVPRRLVHTAVLRAWTARALLGRWANPRHDRLGGENVYPAELENVLADCPAIAEAAVVGVPDPKWGEAVVAAIVRKLGAALDAAAVLSLFDGRLARFKHPRRVVFVDSLPKARWEGAEFELRNWSARAESRPDRAGLERRRRQRGRCDRLDPRRSSLRR